MTKPISLLLVGSSGFLGRAFHESCKREGIPCSHLNRCLREDLSPERQFVIKDLEHISETFDVVVNLAANIPYGQMDTMTPELFEANSILPYRLIRQFPSAHHVYASSVSVYGPNEPHPIDEDAPTKTVNAYGASKLAGECLVRTSEKHTVLRFSSLYGPGMTSKTFLPRLITTALKGKPLTIFGTGERTQDYLHVRDGARMIMSSIEKRAYGVYNAVNGLPVSNRRLAEMIEELIPETTIVFSGTDSTPSQSYSAKKLHAALGMQAIIEIKDGLQEIAADYGL